VSIDLYTAVIDTLIFVLLLAWSFMDRTNRYFREKP
jgi:hypothetical protein